MAIGALHYAADQGLAVPRQLSVTGFDNILFSKFTLPELTTVDLPKLECGAMAFELLQQMLGHPERQGQSVQVKARLIVRQSTGPAPA